jgi:hypothetical protein
MNTSDVILMNIHVTLQARVVADPSKLEVDPRNKIVVEKTERARKRFQAGVKAIKMFKALGKPL